MIDDDDDGGRIANCGFVCSMHIARGVCMGREGKGKEREKQVM